jgi:hypothetical protein
MVRRDQVGTPAQRCGNSDGDKSRRLLVDAAQRRSPLAQKYLEDEPQAGALLLEQAQRRLRRAGRGPCRAPRDAPGRAAARRSQPRRRARRGVRSLLAVCRRADGGTAVEGAPRAVGGVLPVVGAGVAVPHLPLAGAPVEAALVTLAAPLQGPTPDGVRASTVVVLLSPEYAGRWSRSSASPSSRRSAEGAQKRSTATPCSSPPGTGESSRCTTTSRPSSTHAVEATVPGWNQ